MKVKRATDNGNIECDRYPALSRGYSGTLNWLSDNNGRNVAYVNYYSDSITDNSYISDSNIITDCNDTSTLHTDITTDLPANTNLVCNRQYSINVKNNINLCSSESEEIQTTILATLTETAFTPCDNYQVAGNINVSPQATPKTEEQAFEQWDTDDVSDNGTEQARVPRGIVNPNYPGFQHYAHTLQDYSSNIENFYQSENDMTDDDIDVDIVDSSYDVSIKQTVIGADDFHENNNNNNHIDDKSTNTSKHSIAGLDDASTTVESRKNIEKYNVQEIPDLLKNVTFVNNNNDTGPCIEFNCSDADIENNFNTKDIIGDFNKEIEQEIKHLLNYNINIQDDLEELRKDIKETFAKPIENTINNISDVVNHVIKKLVETQSDTNDISVSQNESLKRPSQNVVCDTEDSIICRENESNSRKEMNLTRPTFLLIEQNVSNKISDAFLSDGKDEINLDEYDTEKISNSVENTIKQLSTELRKIIPKLEELRERDKLWSDNKTVMAVPTDGNSNEISTSSIKSTSTFRSDTTTHNEDHVGRAVKDRDGGSDLRRPKSKYKITQRASRERRSDLVLFSASNMKNVAQNNTSVRKNDSIDDCDLGSFDVYNIETAMPILDLDAIENHLKAAKEAERRKRNDREEIRRRLAMGAESEEYYSMGHTDRPGKKPSLHSRMQNGMNLQICFMNETASDNESQASEVEKNINCNSKSLARSSIFSKSNYSLNNHPYQTRPLSVNITKHDRLSSVQPVSGIKLRPSSLALKTTKSRSAHSLGHIELKESDFHALQATLQTEARIALAQAKEMARVQMERERRGRAVSPVTEMLRRSMEKASAPLAPDRRRVSRQLLTDMNIAQLQVIVNELHSQIESLNDSLVKLLMARDELHMGQDSMLVDIEDLTRYLGVKEQTKKTKGNTKSGVKRLTSLVHK